MPMFGGFCPYGARRFGGGRPRIQNIHDSLSAARGTAYDATNPATIVYAEDLAFAREVSAGWGTNYRATAVWDPYRCGMEIIGRWERILFLPVDPTLTNYDRRVRVADKFAAAGVDTTLQRITDLLTSKLGAVFVAVEHISFANANIAVPDGSYPWGAVAVGAGANPWSSTVQHILIKLQQPSTYSDKDFYAAAAKVFPLLDPILPAWVTFDWYRPGSSSVSVSGGPSAANFILNDPHNLGEEVFA